jgi:integrase
MLDMCCSIHLRFNDIAQDWLVIRCSKFRRSRIVPLHDTARVGLASYLEMWRPYAPFDDHVFISLRRKPLCIEDVERAHSELSLPGLACRANQDYRDRRLTPCATHLR